ncbi:MAG: TIGR00266 family protein [Myxococcales bacterium]|nr:TIGR00266 family protein [Myxococcales bacterium]MCB9523497.1 TIGR00266 family protein [Myxococcales bacterium]
MQHTIEYGPAYAWLRVQLAPGETIQAEAGAMVTQSPNLNMETRLNAGRKAGFFRKIQAFFVALMRKVFGGETVFINEFSGPNGGELVLAPSLSGQIIHRRMSSSMPLLVQGGSYLASAGQVDTKLRFAGLRGLLGGEGLFFLESSGDGDLFINAYGGIVEVECNGSYVVDTGHIVAFDASLDFKIKGAGSGLKSLFLSGEGLVMHFSGKGTIYLQSRNVGALVGWISPFLRG